MGVDFETYNALKEKRNKNLHEKNRKKINSKERDLEDDLEKLLIEKKKSNFRHKPLKEFKNNYKNFQYDYEEDPYEPTYDEEY